MRILIATILVAAACGGGAGAEPPLPPTAPVVTLFLDEGVAEPDRVIAGAEVWADLGFRVERAPAVETRRVCAARWYEEGDFGCIIAVHVRADMPIAGMPWGRTIRELREVEIRSDVRGAARARTMAHELGHVLLDVGNEAHLGAGAGVLSQDGISARPTDADRELAAESIGWPWATLEARGTIGDPCEQLDWHGACAAGLECAAAPEGRVDRFCTRECVKDAECGAGACLEGLCVDRCRERTDWPWACPWGEERDVGGACLCIPGRRRSER